MGNHLADGLRRSRKAAPMTTHVIQSEHDPSLFWSNTHGWVGYRSAERFVGPTRSVRLPLEGRWMDASEFDQLWFDTFITALEGATGYWGVVSRYQWRDPDGRDDMSGFVAEIRDLEGSTKHIDLDVVVAGFELITRGEVTVADHIRSPIVAALIDPDDADIDATLADCVVQAGLYQDLIYG